MISVLIISCQNGNKTLNKGLWRAVLINQKGIEIPFNFEVKDTLNNLTLILINGSERLKVNQILVKGDSVFIQLPLFDSEIKGVLNDKTINGVYIKRLANSHEIMGFEALAGVGYRIKNETNPPKSNLSGKWETIFLDSNKKDTTQAVGEFSQIGNKVYGTFLTPTGDFRYLEGIVEGNKFNISTFDGAHAFLFTGDILADSIIKNGKFYSGMFGEETFTAVKNAKAKLPNAYSLTNLKLGKNKLDFSFPNLDKIKVSLNDKVYKNKVVLVQILGSWCPNCMDETAFLANFYKKNKHKGVEIIGLAYERTSDFEKSKTNIEKLIKRFDVKYPILITGFTKDKAQVLKSLPQLLQFVAFPTLLVIDKNGEVQKIHTGFSGPGTGVHYTNFVSDFSKMVDNLRTK